MEKSFNIILPCEAGLTVLQDFYVHVHVQADWSSLLVEIDLNRQFAFNALSVAVDHTTSTGM